MAEWTLKINNAQITADNAGLTYSHKIGGGDEFDWSAGMHVAFGPHTMRLKEFSITAEEVYIESKRHFAANEVVYWSNGNSADAIAGQLIIPPSPPWYWQLSKDGEPKAMAYMLDDGTIVETNNWSL